MTTVDTSAWVLTIHKAYRRVPPSSISLAGETRESLARVQFLPAFLLSSPSFSFSPFSHFTYQKKTRGTTKRNGVSTSAVAATPLPDAKPSVFPSGVVPGTNQPTCPPNSIIMESTTTEGAPVAEGLPEEANVIENSRKTTETETRSTLATAYACSC